MAYFRGGGACYRNFTVREPFKFPGETSSPGSSRHNESRAGEHSSRWGSGGDWKEQTRRHSNHACVELKIQDGGQHTSETDR